MDKVVSLIKKRIDSTSSTWFFSRHHLLTVCGTIYRPPLLLLVSETSETEADRVNRYDRESRSSTLLCWSSSNRERAVDPHEKPKPGLIISDNKPSKRTIPSRFSLQQFAVPASERTISAYRSDSVDGSSSFRFRFSRVRGNVSMQYTVRPYFLSSVLNHAPRSWTKRERRIRTIYTVKIAYQCCCKKSWQLRGTRFQYKEDTVWEVGNSTGLEAWKVNGTGLWLPYWIGTWVKYFGDCEGDDSSNQRVRTPLNILSTRETTDGEQMDC